MRNCSEDTLSPFHAGPRRARLTVLLAAVLCVGAGGCAALTNPVADGVPVRRLPHELLGPTKNDEVTIPLTLLEQKPPDALYVGAGDILGIWIEGVLGEAAAPPPLHV